METYVQPAGGGLHEGPSTVAGWAIAAPGVAAEALAAAPRLSAAVMAMSAAAA
jgi:hypothetical protein